MLSHPAPWLKQIVAVSLLTILLAPSLAFSASGNEGPWARYFPAHTTAPRDEAGWAELARAFPNRVKRAIADPNVSLQAPPATHMEVRRGVDYIRVRRLANDLVAVERALERPRLIIDLRFVRGELDEALQLGALLARRRVVLETHPTPAEPKRIRGAEQVTIGLVNRATSGPLEAVLDALQSAGDILLVGTQTAGDTGSFVPAENSPAWRVIATDHRRADGSSLLDVGVTPSLFVEITPDIEDAAYLAMDAGRPASELLDVPVKKTRFDEARLQQHFDETRSTNGNGGARAGRVPSPTSATSAIPATGDTEVANGEATSDEASSSPAPFDRSLQRAVSTLVAHAILHGAKLEAP